MHLLIETLITRDDVTLLHSARTFTKAAMTSALVSRLRKLKLENFSGKL